MSVPYAIIPLLEKRKYLERITRMTVKAKYTEGYYTSGEFVRFCCDEIVYAIFCEKHDELQGCQWCEFDPYEPCECEA